MDSLSEKDRTQLTMSTASNVIFLPSSHDSQTSSGGAPSEASSARSNYDTPKNVIGVKISCFSLNIALIDSTKRDILVLIY